MDTGFFDSRIRVIPDWPEPGVQFRDITPLLRDAEAFHALIDAFAERYADARIDKAKGVVICSTVDVEKLSPGNQVFPKGIYHHYDYLFYYFNLRENAANRTNKFFKGQ